MNCEVLQRRLLKTERPTRLPAHVQAHLAECPACREWHRQLVQLEEYVGHLPVPDSEAKADLVRLLSPRAAVSGTAAARSWSWRLPAGLAAAVLLLAVGSWLLYFLHPAPQPPSTTPVAKRPLLDNLFERDLRLANAATQRERVEVLADLADDLQSETRELALDADDVADLKTLADLYEQVVREGILARAQALPIAERREVLGPIADRLFKAGKAAEVLAQNVTSDSARPLKAIALAAGDGHRELRTMLQEDTP
jgi:hypothetical protein